MHWPVASASRRSSGATPSHVEVGLAGECLEAPLGKKEIRNPEPLCVRTPDFRVGMRLVRGRQRHQEKARARSLGLVPQLEDESLADLPGRPPGGIAGLEIDLLVDTDHSARGRLTHFARLAQRLQLAAQMAHDLHAA